MHRRGLLSGVIAALGGALAASRAQATTEKSAPAKLKVVYHLNDFDKVNFVLGNIQNHYDGVGGPDNVTIALVIHGQALKAFHTANANPDITQRVRKFSKVGLEMAACGNTLKSQHVTVTDLLPGFVVVEQGGVVRIAELQSRGYLYLKP